MSNPYTEHLLNQIGSQLRARNFTGAESLITQVLTKDPANIRGLCFQAIIAAETGRKELALTIIQKALELGAKMPAVINNAAAVFFKCGQPARACQMWERLAQIVPQSVDAHWNLAMYYVRQGDADNAEAYLRKVMNLAPDHPNVYINLGNLVKNSGRIEEAAILFWEGSRRHPHDVRESSNLLYAMHFNPEFSAEEIHHAHAAWGRAYEAIIPCLKQPEINRFPSRRLRIGYISPYLRNHVIGHNFLPLIRKHDHSQFEIYCYSDTQQQDDTTEQIMRNTHQWRDTGRISDPDLAQMILQDKIDLLVDLNMHMEGVRLGVFARKPAPIQITWMAYPGSTGLTRMDYRLTDAVLDPPGVTDAFYTERSIRLDSFWCYEPASDSPVVVSLPADINGHVTFGCLNNFGKINTKTLEMWRDILAMVPDARLIILPPKGKTIPWLLKILRVEAHRVECLPRQPHQQYLTLYNRIDLALDPFPYTGHTTTLDGLWMGVPLVTLVGSTVASRGSLSILTNLGLQELAASTQEDYIKLAINLAKNRPRLRELRDGLRKKMKHSVLMNAEKFTQQTESAYRMIWQQWCEKANN